MWHEQMRFLVDTEQLIGTPSRGVKGVLRPSHSSKAPPAQPYRTAPKEVVLHQDTSQLICIRHQVGYQLSHVRQTLQVKLACFPTAEYKPTLARCWLLALGGFRLHYLFISPTTSSQPPKPGLPGPGLPIVVPGQTCYLYAKGAEACLQGMRRARDPS